MKIKKLGKVIIPLILSAFISLSTIFSPCLSIKSYCSGFEAILAPEIIQAIIALITGEAISSQTFGMNGATDNIEVAEFIEDFASKYSIVGASEQAMPYLFLYSSALLYDNYEDAQEAVEQFNDDYNGSSLALSEDAYDDFRNQFSVYSGSEPDPDDDDKNSLLKSVGRFLLAGTTNPVTVAQFLDMVTETCGDGSGVEINISGSLLDALDDYHVNVLESILRGENGELKPIPQAINDWIDSLSEEEAAEIGDEFNYHGNYTYNSDGQVILHAYASYTTTNNGTTYHVINKTSGSGGASLGYNGYLYGAVYDPSGSMTSIQICAGIAGRREWYNYCSFRTYRSYDEGQTWSSNGKGSSIYVRANSSEPTEGYYVNIPLFSNYEDLYDYFEGVKTAQEADNYTEAPIEIKRLFDKLNIIEIGNDTATRSNLNNFVTNYNNLSGNKNNGIRFPAISLPTLKAEVDEAITAVPDADINPAITNLYEVINGVRAQYYPYPYVDPVTNPDPVTIPVPDPVTVPNPYVVPQTNPNPEPDPDPDPDPQPTAVPSMAPSNPSNPFVDPDNNPLDIPDNTVIQIETGGEGTGTRRNWHLVFPFCIPYDVIAVVQLFNAEPEAPCFELPIDFGAIGGEYTFELDFSDYENLAQIVRTFEVIAFIYGLMVLSAKVIKW